MMAPSRCRVAALLLYLALFYDAVLPAREECESVHDDLRVAVPKVKPPPPDSVTTEEPERPSQPPDNRPVDRGPSHPKRLLLLAGCSAEIQFDGSPVKVVDNPGDAGPSFVLPQPPHMQNLQYPVLSIGDKNIIWLQTPVHVVKTLSKTMLCATIGSAGIIDVLVQRSKSDDGSGRRLLDIEDCDLSTNITGFTSCSLPSTSAQVVTRNALPGGRLHPGRVQSICYSGRCWIFASRSIATNCYQYQPNDAS